MSKYRATVVISGAEDQHVYGTNPDRVMDRAIRLLTENPPGFAGLKPIEVVLRIQTELLAANRSGWSVVSRQSYNDLPRERLTNQAHQKVKKESR